MKVHLVAFVLGLAAITSADVRDILNNPHQSIYTNGNFAGQPFTKQQYQQQQNVQNPSKQFWWADTPFSPFSKSDNVNTQNSGCGSGCLSQNTLHNTQQQAHTKRNDRYVHNPFMQNVFASQQQYQQQQSHYQQQKQQPQSQPQQYSNIYAQMASLSGTPNEVNSLMTDATVSQSFSQYRPVPKTPCYGASQVCAPKNACRNGFISESDLGLVQSQANNGFCQASEVCCQFSQGKSSNLILDSDFAAAAQSTSEVLTKEGYVVNVPSNQYLPSRPETEFNPDASNQDSSLIKPAPRCQNGAPNYPDCCTNGGSGPYCCTNGVTNNQYCCTNGAQNPSCTFNDETVPQPSPSPQPRPTPAPQPSPTQPPQQRPTPAPQPRPTPGPQPAPTQRPYQPQPTPGPQPAPTQRPYQPQPTPAPQPRPTPAPQPRPTPAPQRPTQRPTQRPYQPQPNVNVQDEAIFFPVACAAAMNCTLAEFCDANGRIAKTQQDTSNIMRVPMTDCLIGGPGGQPGKCCIDPDYTDPWPTGRTGQYVADELNAVFDDGSYRPDGQSQRKRQVQNRGQVAANSDQVLTRVAPPKRNIARRQNSAPQLNQVASENRNFPTIVSAPQSTQVADVSEARCGLRNLGTRPRGKAPLGTGFGEFTWVAMVILESKKALLCGGAIIHKNIVVTSANCVNGQRHNDVLIKAGEWRLGSDEEPKGFQIVRVQRIIFHPQYKPNTLQNDIALLYLENDIKWDDTHIQPICLDESDAEVKSTDECVTTGWGKEVLKVHLGNALMQHVQVSVLPQADCQAQLQSTKLGYSNSVLCGVTQYDACQVDNGSALACTDGSGSYVLKGIYSTETACENPNQIVAFTRTDLQWITSVIRNPTQAIRS
ncbi:inactive serine protease scarface-like isoform X2 [Chironomus tepperi]|uniref:inactive serine protease scarface-like isoform X2 n=1 Tax=Chironomus tepperi TaxID=113505 RepID=UPI00391F13F1